MQLNFQFEEENILPSLPPKDAKAGRFLNELPESCIIADLETTGLDPVKDDIIEISAIKILNKKPAGEFSTLVKPHGQINNFITSLTGITDEMTSNAPGIEKALVDFYAFTGELPIVGHNVKFDLGFLNAKFRKYYQRRLANDYSDTLHFARQVYKNLQSHRLSYIAHYLKIDTTGAHRGLKDCNMTYAVYLDILRRK